jgi:hypothetical protein
MGKYEPLTRYLKGLPRATWDASFEEIEDVLGSELPPSAYRHESWWSNAHRGNHSQAKAWLGAGWYIEKVDRGRKKVRLQRGESRDTTSELQDLWRKAREISGISDPIELEKAAVTTFIRREAAKGLIALGGTMPDFEAPPRERPFE